MAALAALWIVAEPWAYVAGRGDGRLHLTFLDVGQGDSTFIRFPSGTTLLVDAGGLSPTSTFDIGDRVVAPVLRAAGVRRLDFIALTHGDPDHIGGATSVIREFRPKQVWEGIPVPRFEPLRNLEAEARAVGAHWSHVKTGDVAQLDGVEVIVRHPGAPDWERQRVRNDDSIVLELRWLDVSVILTGDIGQAVERTLLSTVPRAPILIVKVPHHGSLTSSSAEFVRALAPRIAVVSAGRSNHFGHPAPDVLRRYGDAGAEVFRTDRDGAVMIDTDGKSVDVHTFRGRHTSYFSNAVHHEATKRTKP
jgi:competence protein ComEC